MFPLHGTQAFGAWWYPDSQTPPMQTSLRFYSVPRDNLRVLQGALQEVLTSDSRIALVAGTSGISTRTGIRHQALVHFRVCWQSWLTPVSFERHEPVESIASSPCRTLGAWLHHISVCCDVLGRIVTPNRQITRIRLRLRAHS